MPTSSGSNSWLLYLIWTRRLYQFVHNMSWITSRVMILTVRHKITHQPVGMSGVDQGQRGLSPSHPMMILFGAMGLTPPPMYGNVSIFEYPGVATNHNVCLHPHELDHPLFSRPPPHELKSNSAHASRPLLTRPILILSICRLIQINIMWDRFWQMCVQNYFVYCNTAAQAWWDDSHRPTLIHFLGQNTGPGVHLELRPENITTFLIIA